MPLSVKYLFVQVVFVCSTFFCSAQDSMIPEVDSVFLHKLIDTAKLYYPRMGTFNHKIIIAKDNVKKNQVSWFDLFTFSFSYSPSGATTIVAPTLTGYQFGIYFNLGNVLFKPHNIKQAKEELAIAKLNKKEYDLNIEAEVKSRYYKYIEQQTILKLQNDTYLDLESVFKQVKYKFEKGEETFENYNKALVAASNQKQFIVVSQSAIMVAKSSLEEIVGKKLSDIH